MGGGESDGNYNDGTCDCSFNCTMQCLDHCQGVHDKFGLFEATNCFRSCNHACLYACVTLGYPTLENYKQHDRYSAAPTATRYDSTSSTLTGSQEELAESHMLMQTCYAGIPSCTLLPRLLRKWA